MKKLAVLIICALVACGLAVAGKHALKFNDGRFRVMQLTDLHLADLGRQGDKDVNDSTFSLIHTLAEEEKPDIIVLTGDNVWGAASADSLWTALGACLESTGVPYAFTFGNHDGENSLGNAEIFHRFIEPLPNNLTFDVDGLSGVGNCDLPVMSSDSSRVAWVLYLLDSHNYRKDRSFGYYDFIKHDQVDWHRAKADEYQAANNGVTVPSLMFFHIPLWEFESVRWSYPHVGNSFEGVIGSNVNSGLFSSILDKGDVVGVFVGHDHNNDFFINAAGNIMLAYGRKTGYMPAYTEVLDRGVRIIDLKEDERAFTTRIRDLKGSHFPYFFAKKNDARNYPLLNGTFGQRWMMKDWDQARWNDEMKTLREAGMRYFVFGNALETDHGTLCAAYPTTLVKKKNYTDALEKCLKAAQENGIRVFVGLNSDDRWWKFDYDSEWLCRQMELGNSVASELFGLYKSKYPDALYGWYWPWEVDNLNWNTPERRQMLVEALNTTLDHITAVSPEMPMMLSPFANAAVGEPAAYGEMWKEIFEKAHFRIGDIFAPQDGIGARGLNLDNMATWFAEYRKAVNSHPGIKLWCNVETFTPKWGPAPLSRLVRQMEIANSYASNIICFAYTHYYNPRLGYKPYHDAYKAYAESGKLPAVEPAVKPEANVLGQESEKVKSNN